MVLVHFGNSVAVHVCIFMPLDLGASSLSFFVRLATYIDGL